MKPKIFCWIQSGKGTDWVQSMAMAEDGHVLAQHVSSTDWWTRHDIGIESDWKHDKYREHYPDGYELEWVDDPLSHPGLTAAAERNKALAEEKASHG